MRTAPNTDGSSSRLFIMAGLAAGTLSAASAVGQVGFVDVTARVALEDADGPISAAHVCAADLDGDGYDDLVIGRTRVFLNRDGENGRVFEEVRETGLPATRRGDIVVFADLDNDGHADALLARSLDVNADNYEPPAESEPQALAWLAGNGDGTFGQPLGTFTPINAATPGTTAAVSLGDLNLDGRLDIVLGQWYTQYGGGFEGFANDVLLQQADGDFERMPLDIDGVPFDDESDAGGRPTYGVLVAHVLSSVAPGQYPQILELNYGRRWNRLWARGDSGSWSDLAPDVELDGDQIRHGRHPDWLKERAKTDPRFYRDDEKPFRANGNSFDASVADINGDGRFDVLVTEITHGWAGESSDPSRVLLREDGFAGPLFLEQDQLSLDRKPQDPTVRSWNQGDIYGGLADFDLDGRLDVLVCSSDYPDNQRLRIWRQQADGSLLDVASWSGIDHIGAGQPAIFDVDNDGDLDIAVGQSFTRLNAAQRAGRTPRVRLFANRAASTPDHHVVMLRLEGDLEQGINGDAIGAMVRLSTTIGGKRVVRVSQIVGPGGHQGKQGTMALSFAVGEEGAEEVEVFWPDREGSWTLRRDLPPGIHTIRPDKPK